MKLKLKPEFLEHSVAGGGVVKRKFKNIHPSEFEKYYNLGYTEYFEVIKEKTPRDVFEVIKTQENNEINDLNDTNK